MSENDRRGSQRRIILRGFKPSLKQVVGGRGGRHALSLSQRMDLFECANDLKLEGFVSPSHLLYSFMLLLPHHLCAADTCVHVQALILQCVMCRLLICDSRESFGDLHVWGCATNR